jgi:RHS repeat-associated protein
LGNTRVSFGRNSAGALEIIDVNDYYPFGMNHLKSGNSFFGAGSYKNYKYNGKELQESGMYDYGARFYMVDIGRWGVVDPLSEKYRRHSTYNYAVNNPIRFIDPDGRGTEDFVQRKDGSIYWDKNANNQATTKSGETYLGKNLSFTFNSYIGSNYDGPLGSAPEGDKLTTTINLSASENSNGELTGLSATKTTEIGKTFGLFQGRDYYPGEGGSNNYFTQSEHR